MKYGLLAVALVFVAGGALAMDSLAVFKTWNYKITIDIETPEGVKTGSAVRQVSNYINMASFITPHGGARVNTTKGEAVVVDLEERGVVFALVEHGSYGELYSAFSIKDPSNSIDGFDRLKTGAMQPLPQKNWPSFVTFTDIKDPKSVTLVRGWVFDTATQKQNPVDEFEKIFGVGVKIKNITITITDERVTWGIEKILPWLPSVKKGSLDGSMTTHSLELSNILHYGNFKQGE